MDELLVLGLDKAGVKACWIKTPDLLKFKPGLLLDRVALIQALFPGINIPELLKSDPAALLHPSKNLTDRVLFLQQLRDAPVTLADVLHAISDPNFALKTVGDYLASSGKSMLQLCTELQAQPGVGAYMAEYRVNPITMNEYSYYRVVILFHRPKQ